MGRKKILFSLDLLKWEFDFSFCCKYIIWKTEMVKEFKGIWFKNRDYFQSCGFSYENGIINFTSLIISENYIEESKVNREILIRKVMR